jgi:hypothetical protein
MRASGCTDLTAMGIESFFVCSLLILLGLGKPEKTENRSHRHQNVRFTTKSSGSRV